MTNSGSSPTVPDASSPPKVSLLRSEVPIKVVTVYKGKAQITRVASFSASTVVGLHEVELKGLRNSALIEETSLTVKGSGRCTILDFAFSDEESSTPEATAQSNAKGKREAGEALKEEAVMKKLKLKAMRATKDKNMQALKEEHAFLGSKFWRNERLREMANRVADSATSAFAPSSVKTSVGASGAAEATSSSMDIDGVSKALDWWEKKAVGVDEECHRLTVEGARLVDAMAKLDSEHAVAVNAMSTTEARVVEEAGRQRSTLFDARKPKSPGRVVVTVDVDELHCPIELEVSYMTRGATWSPAYDLTVDTQTDSMSCTYYGRVSQRTTEDWNGVALKLSTAEPSARSTPPSLGMKLVSLKLPVVPRVNPPTNFHGPARGFGAPPVPGFSFGAAASPAPAPSAGGFSFTEPFGAKQAPVSASCTAFGASGPTAPPPPPQAKAAVAQVEGGSGGMGAVSFAVEKPASIKSNGETKKLSVGVFQLSSEMIHYIVPSKEPTAYLQAKATNNTDYLLLASRDVSIFFDNSFVAKTSIASVSPGESFQTFLGTDPAVKTEVAPPRKTAKTKGLFGKVENTTHTHRTSISNKKKVPITCVLVEAVPRSTDETIKVILQKPARAKVSETADAINDEKLVDMALHMFRASGDGHGVFPKDLTTVPKVVKTDVVGIAKSPTNHLAWVVTIAPRDDISIPLEYTVEWPIDKEVVFSNFDKRD